MGARRCVAASSSRAWLRGAGSDWAALPASQPAPLPPHPQFARPPGVGQKEMNAGERPVIGMADVLNATGAYTMEIPCPRSRSTATIRVEMRDETRLVFVDEFRWVGRHRAARDATLRPREARLRWGWKGGPKRGCCRSWVASGWQTGLAAHALCA